jgi:DNA-binding NarL/FixJ family response regulator
MLRVLVVSPSPAFRAGLGGLLAGAAAGEPAPDEIVVVGAAPGTDALLPTGGMAVGGEGWNVAVVQPRPEDVEELVELAEARPGLRLVVLGPVAGVERLATLLRRQPWGYLDRDSPVGAIRAAVLAVGNGLSVVDPTLAADSVVVEPAGGPLGRPLPVIEAAGEELTPREREVLELVAQGLPNKTIAARLGISEHTVKFHVAAILGKLGAASRAEAVRLGARRGLILL